MRSLGVQKRLRKHRGCVNTISFNEDGSLLLSGSDDRAAVLWNWQEGTPTFAFHTGHSDNVFHALFMPFSGDRSIITCAADGQVYIYILAQSHPILFLPCFHHSPLHRSHGHMFAVSVKQVRHSQIQEGGRVITNELVDTEVAVHKLAIEPGNPHTFFSCGDNGSVFLVSC